ELIERHFEAQIELVLGVIEALAHEREPLVRRARRVDFDLRQGLVLGPLHCNLRFRREICPGPEASSRAPWRAAPLPAGTTLRWEACAQPRGHAALRRIGRRKP